MKLKRFVFLLNCFKIEPILNHKRIEIVKKKKILSCFVKSAYILLCAVK